MPWILKIFHWTFKIPSPHKILIYSEALKLKDCIEYSNVLLFIWNSDGVVVSVVGLKLELMNR